MKLVGSSHSLRRWLLIWKRSCSECLPRAIIVSFSSFFFEFAVFHDNSNKEGIEHIPLKSNL